MLKPRSNAAAIGIHRIERVEELWPAIDALGDRRSFYLLEQFVQGDVFHVDSLVWEREPIFHTAHQYGMPPFIQHAATYALTHDVPEVEAMRLAYQRRRDTAVARLNQVPGLSCHVPEAGMFMMLDVRKTGLSAYDYSWGLYNETGVSVLDASPFGPSAEGHLRVSFVIDEKNLDEACSRIARYTNSLAKIPA